MKNNKFQDVLGYVFKRYNIYKPKIISSKINNDSLEIIFKDKESKMYFINIKDEILSIQRFGNNYIDCYEIVEEDIFHSKRIYEDNGNKLEKIFPDDLEYDIVKHGDVTFYEINEKDYVINKIEDNIYRFYEYSFKNKKITCHITLNVPYNQYLREEQMIKTILKNGNKVQNVENLLSLVEFSIGDEYQNIFIEIKKANKVSTDHEYLETYDGVVRKNKTIIEEETIEYSPINYIKEDNKVKRR